MRIQQIQFKAPLGIGAAIVRQVFGSLPLEGEEDTWRSQEAAEEYCRRYPRERLDVGGYHRPFPGVPEEGVTVIGTPSSRREISFYPPGCFWTVDFGPDGSKQAASELLALLGERQIRPTACVQHEEALV